MSLQDLGKYVRSRRKELKLTQLAVAKKINKDKAYIVRLEAGKQAGRAATIADVAVALELRPGVLMEILNQNEGGLNEEDDDEDLDFETLELARQITELEENDQQVITNLVKYLKEKKAEFDRVNNDLLHLQQSIEGEEDLDKGDQAVG